MNLKNSVLIMRKDWKGTLNNKEILAAIIILPIIFTVGMPLLMMIGVLIDPVTFLDEYPGASDIIALLNIGHLNDHLKAAIFMIK